jgi:hypothetical protein
MERLRSKSLLLACMIMLGLQFCFPVAARAGGSSQVAELISLGVKDAESDADHSSDLDLPLTCVVALVVPQRSEAPALVVVQEADRSGYALLPVCGLHPSAP